MRIKVDFTPSDFIPLSQHELVWRWTDSKYNVLPPADLNNIRAISEAKVKEIDPILFQLLDLRTQELRVAHFTDIHSVGKFNDDDLDSAQGWLFDHVPREASSQIIIWWLNGGGAVLTTADIFCRYWDDFCYPSSDDVLVWSTDDRWAVSYHHADYLSFAFRRRD